MVNKQSSPSAGDMSFSVEMPSFSDTDIVSFPPSNTHKIGDVKKVMSHSFEANYPPMSREIKLELGIELSTWISSGLKCEIIKVGDNKGWKKGKMKLKIVMEYYPDDPDEEDLLTNDTQKVNQSEPSFDDFRLSLNNLRQ